MSGSFRIAAFAALVSLASMTTTGALAQDGGPRSWIAGDWYLTVGVAGIVAPRFEGSDSRLLGASPIISIGRHGNAARFSSRNDSASVALVDQGFLRAGVAGRLLFRRDEDTASELRGLDPVRFGGELGAFAEVYPTDWLRIRGEVRHGIRSHDGVVGDVAVDAFADVAPAVRISGGPRLSFATEDYFDAYYGVSASEAAASGLSRYSPGSGLRSAGLGGAVTWRTTENITTSVFAEYSRLLGEAADSSLVRERGSKDQLMIGLSATYRFDFSL